MAVLWSTAAQHGTGAGGKPTEGGSARHTSTVSMADTQQLTKPACGRGGTQGRGEGRGGAGGGWRSEVGSTRRVAVSTPPAGGSASAGKPPGLSAGPCPPTGGTQPAGAAASATPPSCLLQGPAGRATSMAGSGGASTSGYRPWLRLAGLTTPTPCPRPPRPQSSSSRTSRGCLSVPLCCRRGG